LTDSLADEYASATVIEGDIFADAAAPPSTG